MLGIEGTRCSTGGARVRARYMKTLRPGLISGPFSADDDQTIRDAVAAADTAGHAVVWEEVGRAMRRSADRVRQRYIRTLQKKMIP